MDTLLFKYLFMKQSNLISKLSLFTFVIIFAGTINSAQAQVVFKPQKQKKATSVIFLPGQNKNTPVIVTNGNNLPPGQAKKIYGEKSAKRFAPGQRKKTRNNNIWHYNHNTKQNGKKQSNGRKK